MWARVRSRKSGSETKARSARASKTASSARSESPLTRFNPMRTAARPSTLSSEKLRSLRLTSGGRMATPSRRASSM